MDSSSFLGTPCKLEDSKGNLMKFAGTIMKTLTVMTFKKFY
jgi:hypothetical protein